MKKKSLKFAIVLLCLVIGTNDAFSQQLAFPGAEGFGKYAIGGRNGTVYRVTNLNDSGTGSFRDAVSKSNRIVVFDVAGVIRISSRVAVSSNIYIAGQTAPGEGITIYGNGLSFSGATNTICRYLRIRMGKVGTKDSDALGIANGYNMIFDHVSVAWGLDENFSITHDGKGTNPKDITIQNSIIGQGLLAHSAGGLIQPEGGITIYRTLYIDNDTRNPKFKGTHQFVNNIVYNWKSAAYIMGGDSQGASEANAVSNYFIVGPSGGTSAFSGANSRYSIYSKDNWIDKNRNGILDGHLIPQNEFSGGPTFVSTPYNYPLLPTIPASQVYDELMKSVGASLPYRDNLDWYLLNELSSFGVKGAIINNETDLPFGAPNTWAMWGGNSRTDSDGDGIPDEWETANGLNPNNASDAMQIAANGYTNIENYINSITEEYSQNYLKAPMCLTTVDKTQNELAIEWLGYTKNEEGYIIEEKIGDTFQEVKRVGKGITSYMFTELEAESEHTYRVKAYNGSTETSYTNELTVRTNPIPVEVLDLSTFTPDLIWTGSLSSSWDTTSENWTGGKFESGKTVLFNDTYTGETVINISESAEQANMVVNAVRDYQFTGEAISGTGSVNKAGTGTLTLADNNTYTGGTVIHDGVIVINKLANGGQPSSIGASENYDFNWVWKGGKISYTGGNVTTDRNVALDAATEFDVANSSAIITMNGVVSGVGDFILSGSGEVKTTYDRNTYSGNTILKGGTYHMTGNNVTFQVNKLILEGGKFKTSGGADGMTGKHYYDIQVTGENESTYEVTRNTEVYSNFSGNGDLKINLTYLREYYKGNWDNYTGTLTIVGGASNSIDKTKNVFSLNNENNGAGIPNARIVLSGSARLNSAKSGSTMYLGGLSGSSGSSLIGSNIKAAGTMTWVVGGLGTDEEFNGIINNEAIGGQKGTTHIVKEGDGYWRLNANNIYSGTTTVNRGNLIINGTPTGSAAITVNEDGTLSGTGTLSSAVTVKSGGTLDPGDLGVGRLTIKGLIKLESGSSLNVDIKKVNNTCDRIIASGGINIAGDLNVNLIDGQFANGDSFSIITTGALSGKFANIIPTNPASGLYWDTTSLYTNGILKVTDQSTGIGSDLIDRILKVQGRTIVIEELSSDAYVAIYNITGVYLFEDVISGSARMDVDSGVYFVKIGDTTTKVIVK
ncbi:hypothetical protein D0T53_02875 [Dysgonomonas sp. 216]|uniref:autotransporter-associated beta strand repeat-containing protein n=1 Tax=Dysgonomonas sp. 216 TaxID=2302934 RepID=UPI0013D868BF|nr:autotransporter-associated beta strand repeat-containing protein [Dysgonomonas sp. 216]NDW17860.1 hypothetical protein [Dysgonomonas sp. 216]